MRSTTSTTPRSRRSCSARVTGVIALIALVRIPQASLLGALLAQIVAFIVVSIAGIVFPYRLPQIWEGGGGRRILGVPAVTLAGIGGVIALGGLMIMFIANDTVNATFAVTRGISLKFMIGVIVVGAIWYAASCDAQQASRRRPGPRLPGDPAGVTTSTSRVTTRQAAAGHVVVVGNLTIDDVVLPDGQTLMARLGGNTCPLGDGRPGLRRAGGARDPQGRRLPAGGAGRARPGRVPT